MKIQKKFPKLFATPEYEKWFTEQPLRAQVQIEDRLSKITHDGYFGDYKRVDDLGIWELKWVNGRRLYYAYLEELNILLLLGGNKNGQSKDITKSKRIFKKYTEEKN